jgi:pyruvate/2-oxoglutarate dehydrogenase complex dihydrolipoamide dehydrogenase (E3) component
MATIYGMGEDSESSVPHLTTEVGNQILGVHIFGPLAMELVVEAVTALELEATVEDMMFTIHAHPTVSEGMLDAFSAVEGEAINASSSVAVSS